MARISEQLLQTAWFAAGRLRSTPRRALRRLPWRTGPALREVVGGRVVIVTGASSGIGRQTALRLGAAGATVALVARTQDALEEVRDLIVDAGGQASVHPADLGDLDQIPALATAILDEHGRVDVLVNNAGISIRRSVLRSVERPDHFERTIRLNYLAAVRLTLAVIPAMREQGGGHVVNLSTIAVQGHPPRFAAYVASKTALESFSRVARAELLAAGIRFTNVRMPLVRTPMIAPSPVWEVFPAWTPEDAAQMVCEAVRRRPRSLNTPFGNVMEISALLMPRTGDQLLHGFYRLFPESTPEGQFEPTPLQRRVAQIVGPRR